MTDLAVTTTTQDDPQLAELIAVFDECFYRDYNTRLIRGQGEPIYLPADDQLGYHRIEFAHGFFASALHEVAHWCIAGQQRREQVDFGYWYAPDGRSAEQQRVFESVEVKPQAMEWMFSLSAGRPFRISVDNLNGEVTDPEPFKDAVYEQLTRYLSEGLPERAERFRSALAMAFNNGISLDKLQFSRDEL